MTRKLPPLSAFRHALASVRDNTGMAFRLAWPWYAIVIPLTLLLYLISSDLWATLLAALIALLSSSSIAVNWNRYILLDEVPQGRDLVRLDALVFNYLGNMILIMAAVLLAI